MVVSIQKVIWSSLIFAYFWARDGLMELVSQYVLVMSWTRVNVPFALITSSAYRIRYFMWTLLGFVLARPRVVLPPVFLLKLIFKSHYILRGSTLCLNSVSPRSRPPRPIIFISLILAYGPTRFPLALVRFLLRGVLARPRSLEHILSLHKLNLSRLLRHRVGVWESNIHPCFIPNKKIIFIF